MATCEVQPLDIDCEECPLFEDIGCPTYRHNLIGEGKMEDPDVKKAPDESCDDLDNEVDLDEEELEDDDGPGDPPDDYDDFDEEEDEDAACDDPDEEEEDDDFDDFDDALDDDFDEGTEGA